MLVKNKEHEKKAERLQIYLPKKIFEISNFDQILRALEVQARAVRPGPYKWVIALYCIHVLYKNRAYILPHEQPSTEGERIEDKGQNSGNRGGNPLNERKNYLIQTYPIFTLAIGKKYDLPDASQYCRRVVRNY